MTSLALALSRKTFTLDGPFFVVGLVSALVTIVCVLVHYEMMNVCVKVLPRTSLPGRLKLVSLILAMLLAHVIEVWIFGLTFWFLDAWPALGAIQGSFDGGAMDFIYFSVTTFTTLGYGDFVPTGALTILCGTEALVGLSFIAWTASITFFGIQRDWVARSGAAPPPAP